MLLIRKIQQFDTESRIQRLRNNLNYILLLWNIEAFHHKPLLTPQILWASLGACQEVLYELSRT